MADLKREPLQRYLAQLAGEPAEVRRMSVLGADEDVKSYGYGVPVKLDYTAGREARSAVLHTIHPGSFGHEHMADRARDLLWEHAAFNRLPRHVRSYDVCGFESGGGLVSLGSIAEFGLLTEYVEGRRYADDLERLREGGEVSELDLARADALCDYLVEIHQVRGKAAGAYTRRIRELVGGGECIMGIVDSYGDFERSRLQRIEHLAVDWRWRLRNFSHRLRQVHGDFHPWNILFREGVDFSLLDRSRGEYGDPADDVTSITLNYVFYSLQRSGRLERGFEKMFLRFWDRYLEKTGDDEILRVAAPFLAFRGLVMASPLWYPALADPVRRKLFALVTAVLESDAFDPRRVNDYCGE
ncbi:MAG TPA: phosphotransferase [Bryobacteraceae bacterium]|nr:phosphotransferase [Bryobacteraceae bacterium]